MSFERENREKGEKAFITFASVLLNRMADWIQGTGLPMRSVQQLRFTDRGYGPQDVLIPDYWATLRPHLETIWTMREAEDCVRELLSCGVLKVPSMSDAAGQPIPNPSFEQYKASLINEVITQIVLSLRRHGCFPLTIKQIQETYTRVKETRTSSTKRRRLVVPLINFQSQVVPLKFGSLELAEFSPEEKTAAWNAGPFDMTVTVYDFSQVKYKLSGTYVQGEPSSTTTNPTLTDVESVITALRLLKSGEVGALWTWDCPEDPADSSVMGGAELTPFHARRFGSGYSLCSEDIQELTIIFDSLKSLRAQGSLRSVEVGIRRFNQAYGRKIPEDRIIDLTVALENLLLTGISDELQFRLAMRGAALLRESWQPTKSFSLLQAIYKARSSIVHDGKTLDDPSLQKEILSKLEPKLDSSRFLDEAERIVRAVLREYLDLLVSGASLKKINDDLDRSVLDSLGNGT